MIGTADPDPIYSKRKAITAFFPFAAWRGRNGQHRMLDTLLYTARASGEQGFMWYYIKPVVTMLLNEESPVPLKQAVILLSPHLTWWNFTDDKHLTQSWAAATSAIPYTHDVGQCVVDTLLLIGSQDSLRPHLPVGMWSWLNKRPSLPPICIGRSSGTEQDSVQTVRGLGDIETLTSYLLLVWSEWDGILSGFEEMRTSIKEDFSGIETEHHRRELLQRLDHVLEQLDRGLAHLLQQKPNLPMSHIWVAKAQYGELREVLLEADREANNKLIRETPELTLLFGMLTLPHRHWTPLNVHVCDSSPVPLIASVNHRVPRPPSMTPLTFLFSLLWDTCTLVQFIVGEDYLASQCERPLVGSNQWLLRKRVAERDRPAAASSNQ